MVFKECCYCFVDEILKGINMIEWIVFFVLVVWWFVEYLFLVFVVIYDIELIEILKNYCENVYFEE